MDFPLTDDIKDDSDRIKAIRDILRNIVNHSRQPIELSISEENVQEIGDMIYKKQLSSLLDIDDKIFMYWLVVGYVNNLPLLTWLVDAYMMENAKNYLQNPNHHLSVSGWAVDHKFMKNVQNTSPSKNVRDTNLGEMYRTSHLEGAMYYYGFRVLPRFQYYNSYFLKIDD
eukprot:717294_1